MLVLKGFTIHEEIYSAIYTRIYRGVRKENNQKVILKTRIDERFSDTQRNILLAEYKKGQSLEHRGIAKYLDVLIEPEGVVLVIADIDGITLHEFFGKTAVSLGQFLDIAIQIAESLAYIHSKSLVHKDINFSNIIINPDTFQVQIIDFGISSALERVYQESINPDLLEGTLAFISPEQTGRVSRAIDYRSDIYSLGATFYYMLAGRLPFVFADSSELVFAHLTQNPAPLHTIPSVLQNKEAVPQTIASMVAKMMAKNAEDRYQTVLGLQHDLEQAKKSVSEGQTIDFEIARYDFSDRLLLPQKLYGRENEIEKLAQAFEKACAGQSQFVLVTGVSGIGKSSIIHSVKQPLTEKKGYFISGKFDQLKRNIPYFALIQAFSELVRQILTEDESQIYVWKQSLATALGANAGLICELVPELEILLGKQAIPENLPAMEAQNRFRYVFEQFVAVFAQAKHPLILFVDDLQWADSATLNLIETMLAASSIKSLFLIGAYRHNEMAQNPHLQITLDKIKEQRSVEEIKIKPLDMASIQLFLTDTLRTQADTSELAELLKQKTVGNPFFLGELVKALYVENTIYYQVADRQWKWDVDKIKNVKLSDNVVDLLIKKMRKLPEDQQTTLMYAACWGSQFTREDIYSICPLPKEKIDPAIDEAIAQDFLSHWKNSEAFVHDRVQQAAYALVPESQKASIHAQIGKKLWNREGKPEETDNIFDVLNHLNQGVSVLEASDKAGLIQLNFVAGKRAKNANAYTSAVQYLSIAKELASDRIWESDYGFAKNLWKEYAEVVYLSGNIDFSQNLIAQSLEKCKTEIEKVDFYLMLVLQYALSARYEEAIALVSQRLESFGYSLPSKEELPAAIGAGFGESFRLLENKTVAELVDLPVLSDPLYISILKLQSALLVTAYVTDQNLFALLVVRMTNLSMEHGNISQSAYAYGCFGIILNAALGNISMGYDFGLLSLRLAEKLNNTGEKSRAAFHFGVFTGSWAMPIKKANEHLEKGYVWGLESGDLQYAGFCANYISIYAALQDKDLLGYYPTEVQKTLEFIQKTKNLVAINNILAVKINFFFLAGLSKADTFDLEDLSEEDFVKNCTETKSAIALLYFYLYKSVAYMLLGDAPQSIKNMAEAEERAVFVAGTYFTSEFQFYQAIVYAQYFRTAPAEAQSVWREKIEANLTKFQNYAQLCPENFLHKKLLIQAELAALDDKDFEAVTFYGQAIESARENKFLPILALANQLAARFWERNENQTYQNAHFEAAYGVYAVWGAKRVCDSLAAQYPYLELGKSKLNKQNSRLTPKQASHTIHATATHHASATSLAGTSSDSLIDLQTLIKASAAISDERQLDRLLSRMIQVLMENAGAQRVVVVRQEKEKLYLQATSEGETFLTESVAIEDRPELLSVTIANYVRRTKEAVVLEDAGKNERFAKDVYIKEKSPKSVLALPIMYQGGLTGILYMENNLTYAAFKLKQLEMVKMLSSQMAISLENALVYQNLEEKVQERTQQLNDALGEIQENIEKLNVTLGLVESERAKSDKLLLNILPLETAQELKEKGYATPKHYDQITVLFTDFKGFTSLAEKITPAEVIQALDVCFLAFDDICEKHNLEKIKTIGDSYMCAGGLPKANTTNPIDVVTAGLEMQEWMAAWAKERKANGQEAWELRLGIHTGEAIAGVVGKNKFAYDIWGDTVNLASRMESSGEVGRVNISATTYALVKHKFSCIFRGKITAKNKGAVSMYFVDKILQIE